MATKIPDGAKPESRVKRLSRWLKNEIKELTVFALMYNLIRFVMIQAARRQQVAIERILIDAMRWLASAQDDEPLPALVVNPHRPNRYEPRVRKQRPKPYPLMTKPRHQLRNLLVNQQMGLT